MERVVALPDGELRLVSRLEGFRYGLMALVDGVEHASGSPAHAVRHGLRAVPWSARLHCLWALALMPVYFLNGAMHVGGGPLVGSLAGVLYAWWAISAVYIATMPGVRAPVRVAALGTSALLSAVTVWSFGL